MTRRKRYALVGTGARAGMFVDAITTTYQNVAELVALCDQSQTRMNWYNGRLQNERGLDPLPAYFVEQFDCVGGHRCQSGDEDRTNGDN